MSPLPFAERRGIAFRAKSRIVAKLAELIPDEGTIALDASSTVMRLARSLGDARDLSVLTDGLDTFAALQGLPGVRALLTGGRLEPPAASLVGPLACRGAAQLSVHRCFASAAANDPQSGGLETTLEEAEVKRCIAAGAQEVVLAVDASKLDARAPALGLAWERVDLLVTDLDPSDERLAPYRDLAELR